MLFGEAIMATLNTIGEILEFAIAREGDSSEYYREMAQAAEKGGVRELFEELGAMELEHKAALELGVMKEGLVLDRAAGAGRIEPDNYLVAGDLRQGAGRKDVLALAVEKEKMSFRFYVDLAGLFREDEGLREVLVLLAEEEARHVLRVQSEYEEECAREK